MVYVYMMYICCMLYIIYNYLAQTMAGPLVVKTTTAKYCSRIRKYKHTYMQIYI